MSAKKILIALLLTSSAAVWAPQVWEAYQNANEPEEAYPSADGATMPGVEVGATTQPDKPQIQTLKPLSEAADPMVARAALNPKSDVTEGAGNADTSADESRVAEMLDALQSLSGGQPESLSDLLETTPSWLNAPVEPVRGERKFDLADRLENKASGGFLKPQERRIESFLEGAQLSAIVTGEESSWALLGGRIVRDGDVLLPKILIVKTIGKTGVTLSSPKGPIELLLPAFQTRDKEAVEPAPDVDLGEDEELDENGAAGTTAPVEMIAPFTIKQS